jgi:hypothetical protein
MHPETARRFCPCLFSRRAVWGNLRCFLCLERHMGYLQVPVMPCRRACPLGRCLYRRLSCALEQIVREWLHELQALSRMMASEV